jgi:hypothetical protein
MTQDNTALARTLHEALSCLNLHLLSCFTKIETLAQRLRPGAQLISV